MVPLISEIDCVQFLPPFIIVIFNTRKKFTVLLIYCLSLLYITSFFFGQNLVLVRNQQSLRLSKLGEMPETHAGQILKVMVYIEVQLCNFSIRLWGEFTSAQRALLDI
jgi:hypothetical protein